jgi:serine/threonine protein kinase
MAASARVSEGSELGSYRILHKLGEGGMGAVFEGVHTGIGRHAAIKVLHAEHAVRTDVVQRFFNEARAVNLIDHPALVQIWDFGQGSDGTAYIVMEFLRGESLGKKIKREGPLAVTDALDITRQIAGALAAVHAQQIVHRDLKPDNVMLVPNADGSGRLLAKLLDFGIAKLMEGKQAGDVQTSTDMVLGTPAYMSPEQCRGANKVDGRADVYSLGVMLYEMLGGRRPFIAEGSGAGAVFGMHMYEEPRPIREHAPNIPDNVATLVHRLLIKDRNLRPTSSEVVQLIQQLSEGGGIAVPTPSVQSSRVSLLDEPRSSSDPTTLGSSVGESPPAGVRRRQAILSAALVFAVALSVVLFAVLGRWPSAPSPPVAASAPERKTPQPSAPTVASRTVVWSIASMPAGAEVVNKSTGSVLGPTPLTHTQPAAAGQVVLSIRLPGYQPTDVVLDADSNHQIDRRLLPAGRLSTRPTAHKSSAGRANASPSKRETPRAQGPSPRQNLNELLEK